MDQLQSDITTAATATAAIVAADAQTITAAVATDAATATIADLAGTVLVADTATATAYVEEKAAAAESSVKASTKSITDALHAHIAVLHAQAEALEDKYVAVLRAAALAASAMVSRSRYYFVCSALAGTLGAFITYVVLHHV